MDTMENILGIQGAKRFLFCFATISMEYLSSVVLANNYEHNATGSISIISFYSWKSATLETSKCRHIDRAAKIQYMYGVGTKE
jgi:hypothetical protein